MNNKFLIAFLCAITLAGCSKRTEEASADVEANAEQVVAADAADAQAAVDAMTNEPNTTPVTEQKPDVILNTQDKHKKSARRMVREANINFSAQDV